MTESSEICQDFSVLFPTDSLDNIQSVRGTAHHLTLTDNWEHFSHMCLSCVFSNSSIFFLFLCMGP